MGIADNEQLLKRIKAVDCEDRNEAINPYFIYSSHLFPISEVFFIMPASGIEKNSYQQHLNVFHLHCFSNFLELNSYYLYLHEQLF